MVQCTKEIKLSGRTLVSLSLYGLIQGCLKMTFTVNFQLINRPWVNNFSVMNRNMNFFTASTGMSKMPSWQFRVTTTTLCWEWVTSSVWNIERSKHIYSTRWEAMSSSNVKKYSGSTCANSEKLGSTSNWKILDWLRSIDKSCALKNKKYL